MLDQFMNVSFIFICRYCFVVTPNKGKGKMSSTQLCGNVPRHIRQHACTPTGIITEPVDATAPLDNTATPTYNSTASIDNVLVSLVNTTDSTDSVPAPPVNSTASTNSVMVPLINSTVSTDSVPVPFDYTCNTYL